MFDQIKKLAWFDLLMGLFGLLGAIAPGFLVLYIYKPSLIMSLETTKLLIFSLALSLPVVVFNLLVSASSIGSVKEDQKNLAKGLVSLFLTFVVFYSAILAAYIFSINFKLFLVVIVVTQLLVTLFLFLDKKINKSSKKDAQTTRASS